MSILAWIEDKKRLKLLNAPKYVHSASDSSKGLWTRCDKCGVILYIKHLKENQRVCFGCSYHLQMNSQERVENLLDKDTWRPFDETLSPCDPLQFQDQREYTDRLEGAQERTGLQDAIQTGSGMVDGIPVALGVMDFDFMGGSMGSVVGEKITRLIEYATQEGLTLILVCASGGARMQEGVFSLMQMAKISSALQVYQSCANLLYLAILTSPTTGGVTASFAMLGDIIFAEPKALIGFAGRRVIEQTLCEDLPEDFQTSEYMLHHGLLDLIVPRRFLRQALSETIRLYKDAPFKKTGNIPFGIQNPISFITEEKVRRRWVALKHQDNAEISSNVLPSKNTNSTVQFNDAREQFDLGGKLRSPFYTPSGVLHADTPTSGEEKSGLPEIEGETPDAPDFTYSAENISKVEDFAKLPAHSSPLPRGGKVQVHSGGLAPLEAEIGGVQSIEEASNTTGAKDFQESSDIVSNKDSSQYREILTSFQTMFTLFSKEMAVCYLPHTQSTIVSHFSNTKKEVFSKSSNWTKQQKDAKRDNTLYIESESSRSTNSDHQDSLENVTSSQQAGFAKDELLNSSLPPTNVPSESAHYLPHHPPGTVAPYAEPEKTEKLYSSFSSFSDENTHPERANLLQMFRHLSETQKIFTEKDLDKVQSHAKNLQNSVSFASQQPTKEDKGDIEFLNEAIELAANESVEWRAFYIHQKVSKTTGFLEDFAPYETRKEGRQILQNTLFYKAICKEVEVDNSF